MAANTLLRDALRQVADSQEVVEVFRDRLAVSALQGRILQFSDTIVVMEELSEGLLHDGYVAIRPEHVTRLVSGSPALVEATSLATPPPAESFPEVGLLELSSIATVFQRRFGYAVFHPEAFPTEMVHIGQMVEVDDVFLHLRTYPRRGGSVTHSTLLRYDDLTRVSVGGAYEESLVRAWNRRESVTEGGTP